MSITHIPFSLNEMLPLMSFVANKLSLLTTDL